MCGRYYLSYSILALLHPEGCKYENADEISPDAYLKERICEIKPGDTAPAIILTKDGLNTKEMHWGFHKQGSELIINARYETMHQKPLFSVLASNGRCLLPASGYYEWRKGDGQKYNISVSDADAFYLAGLCRKVDGIWQFVVLTQPPMEALSRIHHRMPLILRDKKIALAWLNGKNIECNPIEFDIRPVGVEQLAMDFERRD